MTTLYKWGKYNSVEVGKELTLGTSVSRTVFTKNVTYPRSTTGIESSRFRFINKSTGLVESSNTGYKKSSLDSLYSDLYDIADLVGECVAFNYLEQTELRIHVGSFTNKDTQTSVVNGKYFSFTPVYGRGSYIADVTSSTSTAYPQNGKSGSYWYVYKGVANQAPTISGNNLDLGSKLENFDVEYIINDPDQGDNLTVDILVDGVKKVSAKSVTAGIKNTYRVNLDDFTLGEHEIKIIAYDGTDQSEPRTYTFYKSNSAPVISGFDRDLGDKSTPFTETFTVYDSNNDPVSVIVTLNGGEIKSISNAQGQDQSFTVTQEVMTQLEIGSLNTIVIRADDGKGGISYRRLTFTRDNRAPIISGTDSDLGDKTEAFNLEYEITDLEGDAISSEIYLNGLLLEENKEVEDGVNNTFQLPHKTFIELPPGQHTIKILATDSQGGTSERVHTFTKVIENIEFYLQIQKTDVRVEKILAIFNKFIAEGDTFTLKASNNFSDENPTWEDITDNSEKKLAYIFENQIKTAEVWDLGLWCKVVKANSGIESVFRGVSGGFE